MKPISLEHLPDSENIKPSHKHSKYSKNFYAHTF